MKHRLQQAVRRPQARGVTLIEVLVSMLLMALGVLAMAAQQATAIKYAKTSEARALASLLANDLADRMRANRNADGGMGAYELTAEYSVLTAAPASATKSCQGATAGTPNTCTHAQMAAFDLAEWRQTLFNQLPQGTAYVQSNGDSAVSIWVAWTDPNSDAAELAIDDCPDDFVDEATAKNVRCMFFNIVL